MRPIDADAFFENITGYAPPEMVWDSGDIEHKLDEMPTLTLDDLREKGKWELTGEDDCIYASYFCSLCGWNVSEEEFLDGVCRYHYCPNCGAKMGGGE